MGPSEQVWYLSHHRVKLCSWETLVAHNTQITGLILEETGYKAPSSSSLLSVLCLSTMTPDADLAGSSLLYQAS